MMVRQSFTIWPMVCAKNITWRTKCPPKRPSCENAWRNGGPKSGPKGPMNDARQQERRIIKMNRREFFRALGIGAASLGLSGCASASERSNGKASKERPNILFCLADDWSWPYASIAGDKV